MNSIAVTLVDFQHVQTTRLAPAVSRPVHVPATPSVTLWPGAASAALAGPGTGATNRVLRASTAPTAFTRVTVRTRRPVTEWLAAVTARQAGTDSSVNWVRTGEEYRILSFSLQFLAAKMILTVEMLENDRSLRLFSSLRLVSKLKVLWNYLVNMVRVRMYWVCELRLAVNRFKHNSKSCGRLPHTCTAKLVYKDHTRNQQNVVLTHRWSLYTVSITWKVYPWEPV